MLTKKVNMYGGYLHILGMINDCKEIADIDNHKIKKQGRLRPCFLKLLILFFLSTAYTKMGEV